MRTEEFFEERARRADPAKVKRILARMGKGNPPVEGDELPPEFLVKQKKKKCVAKHGSQSEGRPKMRVLFVRSKLLRGTADDVELHEVCGAADAHGRACDDADDVAFANEAFFEQTLLGDGG
jgi:hypothetical protein